MKMTGYFGNIGFTKKAYDALKAAGATQEVLIALVSAIERIRKTKYDIESADNLSCLGIELSWLKNHANGTGLIFTREEAKDFDSITL